MNKGKKIKKQSKIGVCAVHFYGLDDNKKRKITYCKDCGVWMCQSCTSDIVLRTMALINKAISKKKK